jgi:prolyl oligopeptidase
LLPSCKKTNGNESTDNRIDVKAGHGAGKSAATIQENVDIQAFTLYNMGFKATKLKRILL